MERKFWVVVDNENKQEFWKPQIFWRGKFKEILQRLKVFRCEVKFRIVKS